jgi:hypothetical protein
LSSIAVAAVGSAALRTMARVCLYMALPQLKWL